MLLQAGVHLHQIHRHQVARLVHTLADEVTLAQRQSTTHRGTRARRPLRVQRVDVERQVDRRVIANVRQGHFDHAANAVPAGCQNTTAPSEDT